MNDHIRELFDEKGNLIGCLLTAEAWLACGDNVKAQLGVTPAAEEEPAEPIHEWETLKEYWDFNYPPSYDVSCDECGSKTENWLEDEPREFRLTSANLGGLVSFRCLKCQARVQKKHFKDEVVSETTPYQENKRKRLEAQYD